MHHKYPVVTSHPLSDIAEQLKTNPEDMVFGHEGSTFTTVRLLPTARSVVERIANAFDAEGGLAQFVHLQTQDVPEDKDSRVMVTGLVIPADVDNRLRRAVVQLLNKFLPENERLDETSPEPGEPTIISQEQLTDILAAIKRRELAARDSAESSHAR